MGNRMAELHRFTLSHEVLLEVMEIRKRIAGVAKGDVSLGHLNDLLQKAQHKLEGFRAGPKYLTPAGLDDEDEDEGDSNGEPSDQVTEAESNDPHVDDLD